MARLCDMCAKGIMYGNKVSHAKNRSKRTFKPNLHSKKISVGSGTVRVKLCTSCIKLMKKSDIAAKEASSSSVTA